MIARLEDASIARWPWSKSRNMPPGIGGWGWNCEASMANVSSSGWRHRSRAVACRAALRRPQTMGRIACSAVKPYACSPAPAR